MEEVTKKLATEKQVENMLDLGDEKEKVVNGCHDVFINDVCWYYQYCYFKYGFEYCCIIVGINRSEAVNLLRNASEMQMHVKKVDS